MILGIGIDSIEIERFSHWPSYSHAQLRRIFSSHEIAHCLEIPLKSAERFAVRFAAREALWKALCQAWPEHSASFLHMCRSIEVAHVKNGAPYFIINQEFLAHHLTADIKINLSLTHTQNNATAFVIISKN